METITGLLPHVVKFCPGLNGKKGFDNVFDEVERGLFAIDTHENGLCVFAYKYKSAIRCSLHSVAEQLGKSAHLLKPYACTLWPLVLREPPHAALSICDDALQLPCNKACKEKGTISPEILDSITKIFGVKASDQISRAARNKLPTTRVRLSGPVGRPSLT